MRQWGSGCGDPRKSGTMPGERERGRFLPRHMSQNTMTTILTLMYYFYENLGIAPEQFARFSIERLPMGSLV